MKARKDGSSIVITKDEDIFVTRWPGPINYAIELISNHISLKVKRLQDLSSEIDRLYDQRKAMEELAEKCI